VLSFLLLNRNIPLCSNHKEGLDFTHDAADRHKSYEVLPYFSMREKEAVIQTIREAFRETDHPGDAFLVGSREGCEPAEVIAPFLGVADWSAIEATVLDDNSEALSFFSEGGFRFFLPAYLVANLKESLQRADPVFHLTNGFSDTRVSLPAGGQMFEKTVGKSALVNPRRFGALTFYDYACYRLSIFTREESGAIVAFLEYRRDADPSGFDAPRITAALDGFWQDRAVHAPTCASLRKHVDDEAAYLRGLQRP